ncbi:DUF4829 domain-containing protein [Clostridium kluyveri]
MEYDVKYKKGAIVAEESGTYQKWRTLIRKDNKSSWLIDEIGEG